MFRVLGPLLPLGIPLDKRLVPSTKQDLSLYAATASSLDLNVRVPKTS